MITVFGGVAALFAAALILLPLVRLAQGRLQPRQALGLWISGAGFLLLAAAALGAAGGQTGNAVVTGVALALVGNIVQRRAAR